MNKEQFTPGPWKIELHDKESKYFGNVVGSYGKGENGFENIRTITCQLKWGTEEENEANANLIAASPDMYEALNEMIEAFDFHQPCRDANAEYQHYNYKIQLLIKAKAVLNKANPSK